jgi:D-glucosaminate-6-phosphate ammonia-lyase
VRELFGTIEGDQVKLRSMSAERGTGDSVTFTFSGAVSGDTFSGPIYMGEYLNAKFTARRHGYPAVHERILVPSGPPLAN